MEQQWKRLIAGASALAVATGLLAQAPVANAVTPPVADHPLLDTDANGVSDALDVDIAEQVDLGALGDLTTPVDVIVRSTPGTDPQSVVESLTGPLASVTPLPLVNGIATTLTLGDLTGVGAHADVIRVEPDALVELIDASSNDDYGVTAAAADFGATGTGAGICIPDSGVNGNHEQFDSGQIAGWHDLVNGSPVPVDDNGHGTHVATIAVGDGTGLLPDAAKGRGVAPGAALYAVKTHDAAGSGVVSRTIEGLDWCVRQPGVDVISMSWRLPAPADGTDALSVAANNAHVLWGKVMVGGAGNEGVIPGQVGSPAAATHVIAVGAVDDHSGGATSLGIHLAPLSSRGPTADGRMKPDIVAPGASVLGASHVGTSTLVEKSGTSMATPFVAGAVALARAAKPALTADQLRALVTDTAFDVGPVGPDIDWGHGLIDVHAMLASATRAPNSVAPHSFPAIANVTGEVAGATFRHEFTVTDTAIPIAATILLDGAETGSGWSVDLDARLLDPTGATVDTSECDSFLSVDPDCIGGAAKSGRQETLTHQPATTGIYAVEVFAGTPQFPGPALAGTFAMVLSHGGEPPRIQIDDATVTEGSTAVVTLHRLGDTTGAVSVEARTVARSADSGEDYVGLGWTLIEFPAGVTTATLDIDTLVDGIAEADETFLVRLRRPVGATLVRSRAKVTITENEPPPPELSVDDVTVDELAGVATVTVTRSGSLVATSSVRVRTRDSTTVAGEDYTAVRTTVTFPGRADGATTETATVDIPITVDAIAEGNEKFRVILHRVSNAVVIDRTGIVTIADIAAAPEIRASTTPTAEGEVAVVTLTRSGDLSGPSSVLFRTLDHTATGNDDYVPRSLEVIFAPGEDVKTVEVRLLHDGVSEGDETLKIKLRRPRNAELPQPRTLLTIVDVDDPPSVT